jgi:hypothetical protein
MYWAINLVRRRTRTKIVGDLFVITPSINRGASTKVADAPALVSGALKFSRTAPFLFWFTYHRLPQATTGYHSLPYTYRTPTVRLPGGVRKNESGGEGWWKAGGWREPGSAE